MLAEKVCRVCLSECDELTPLWVKLPGENRTLEETINFVVNINIMLEDGLPDKICKICESILDVADTFKKRCLESESILGQQAQKKQNDESQPKCEKNHQENSEIHSDDTSCLPSSMSHTSVTDSLREITENIYDLPEYKIKMEIEEHHVDAEGTISVQESLDTVQDFQTSPAKANEPCLIKEEVSEKNMKHSGNKEIFSCPHCTQTFQTKISYKVHILCLCEPKDLKIILYKCALCKETFTSKDSFEAHLTTHRSQKNSDRNGQLTSSSGGDSQPVLFLSEELHTEDTKDHAQPLAAHQTDGPSPKEPKLDDMQPTTAAVRSPTEDPAAADTSTDTIIETEANCDKAENSGFIKQKKHVKNLKLKEKGEKIISKGKMKKASIKDTASMLKLSGTNTDDKITGATETQATCISNTVIGATGDTLTCDICGYTATTEKSLNSHLKAHTAAKQYSCDSCPYLTTHLGNFNEHVKTHTGNKPYSCDECKKKFSQRVYLAKHLKTHTGDKPYSCDMCETNFAWKSYLVIHSRIHSGEKPYSCEVCLQKFTQKSNLVKHLRTHTGEKPYSCDMCEKKFIQRPHLVAHLKTHTGNKPYSCDMCQKNFAWKSYLVRHRRIHTGEKPYSCDVCLQKFNQKSHLVKHLRTHTVEKPYSCDMCEWKFNQKYHLVCHVRNAHC